MGRQLAVRQEGESFDDKFQRVRAEKRMKECDKRPVFLYCESDSDFLQEESSEEEDEEEKEEAEETTQERSKLVKREAIKLIRTFKVKWKGKEKGTTSSC